MDIQKMINFQKPKLLRAIKNYGRMYVFTRQSVNKFGEKVDDPKYLAIQIKGLYHETNDRSLWLQLPGADAGKVTSHASPMILVKKEDFDRLPIKVEDELVINDVKYRVNGITDLWEANFAIDISIEVIE